MSSPISLIVGLGNPGPKYAETRHNAGFWFADEIGRRCGGTFRNDAKFHGETCRIREAGRECWLLKPGTFMNRSGQSVSSFAKYFDIPMHEILVVHDELDLDAGVARLKQAGGHAGHNGLRDIISALGGRDFWRLRLGIAHPGDSRQVVDYVLGRPSKEDAQLIDGAIDNAARELPNLLTGEFQRVMHRLHATN